MAVEFTSLRDVAEYLRRCRLRKLQTGDFTFEPNPGAPDCSVAVLSFFREHPEYAVRATQALRFVGFSESNLNRLNTQLAIIDQTLEITEGNQLGLVVNMGNKYGR